MPALSGKELLRGIPMSREAELVSRDVFSMDSSNIQPEEWGAAGPGGGSGFYGL